MPNENAVVVEVELPAVPIKVKALEECRVALLELRSALSDLRSPAIDFRTARTNVHRTVDKVRATAESASPYIFEVRRSRVSYPFSSVSREALCTYPSSPDRGIWAAEISWLDGVVEADQVIKLRESAIKWHGRLRRRFLTQNPISSGESFRTIVSRVLSVKVLPIAQASKRSKTKRQVARAMVWINALLILVRNSESTVGAVYVLSYCLASAPLGRKL